MTHIPVMSNEIISIFKDSPAGVFIDATFGLGGHSKAIIESFPGKFRVIGFDRDSDILQMAKGKVSKDIILRNESFSNIPSFINHENINDVAGVLYDLGLNSAQIDDGARGFSYLQEADLDMRFDRNSSKPLGDLLKGLSESELIFILKEYGQEKKSRAIARKVKSVSPETTTQLAEIIRKTVGPAGFIKSASRIFQALRIFVNDELNEFSKALKGIVPCLMPGAHVAVLSYHSLEDRIVKEQFKLFSGKCACGPNIVQCECGAEKLLEIKSKKPLRPSDGEIRSNPRSKPARLRYARKI